MNASDSQTNTWSTVPERLLSGLKSGSGALPGGPLELSVEETFGLVSNGRRRAVIEHVAALSPGESTSIGTLAESIAGEENDVSRERVTTGQRKSVYVSLLQCHLPKLSEAGVVDWDERAGTVERGHSVDGLAALVGTVEGACEH